MVTLLVTHNERERRFCILWGYTPPWGVRDRASPGYPSAMAGHSMRLPDAPNATSAASMAAASWLLLTKVVGQGLPFRFTTDSGTKPMPLTVSVKPGPPARRPPAVRVSD